MSVPNIVEIAYAPNISGTLQDIYDCARNMSEDKPTTCQLSINYNMDAQFERRTYGNGATFTFQGIYMGLGVRTHGQSLDNQNF